MKLKLDEISRREDGAQDSNRRLSSQRNAKASGVPLEGLFVTDELVVMMEI